jgi:nuclear-control-of-ATPase protein 2
VPLYRIRGILEQAQVSKSCTTCAQYFTQDEEEEEEEMVGRGVHVDPTYEHELEWLLLSKATVQVYGQVLNTILEQTIPLSEDIWYWDDILGTYANAGLYSVQTSPLRLWGWTKGVWHDVRARGRLAEGWGRFYGLVRDVVRERSMEDIQRRVVSPLAQVYDEARRKQARLKRIRQINANALGVLLGEGLSNDRYVRRSMHALRSSNCLQHPRRRSQESTRGRFFRYTAQMEDDHCKEHCSDGCYTRQR